MLEGWLIYHRFVCVREEGWWWKDGLSTSRLSRGMFYKVKKTSIKQLCGERERERERERELEREREREKERDR